MASTHPELRRAIWEREMNRLRTGARVLSAVLVALIARVLISGPNFATELSGGIIAVLLLATVLLTRRGHQLEPPSDSD
jgi:hypothetical protein